MSSTWLYPLILIAGALQAWGPPMNGALRIALTNPWLASLVSFIPIVAFLVVDESGLRDRQRYLYRCPCRPAVAQITAKSFHPFLYWAVIVATTTAGTTMPDFADRSLDIG